MRRKGNDRKAARKPSNMAAADPLTSSDQRLFMCVVSGNEKGGEDDERITFEVLLPARRVDEVPELLEKHLKRLRREGKMFAADRAMTLYLDHIFEFVGPVKTPVMINYRSAKAVGSCAEIGCFTPEDCDGVIEGYGWSPSDTPPSDEGEPELRDGPKRGLSPREVILIVGSG